MTIETDTGTTMTTTAPTTTPTPTTPAPPDRARPDRAAGLTDAAPLRNILRIDSWGTAAFGVFLLALGSLIDGPLGFPLSWSVPFGVAMLGGALVLGLIAGYPVIPVRFVRSVVQFNLVASAALVVLAFVDLMPLTAAGVAFVLSGAAIVAAFAVLEYAGWRRAERGSRA